MSKLKKTSLTSSSEVLPNDILAVVEARTTAMTILECAELLQIDKLTLYKHARKGSFPVFHVAGNVRVNPAELAEHIRTGSNSQLIQADRR